MVITIILLYLLIINITAYVLYYIDKERAKHNKWRISENTLIILCMFGGSVGAMLAMKVFRHKTKHIKFKFGVPAILAVQLILTVSAGVLGVNMYINSFSKQYMTLPENSVDAIIVPGARVHGENVSSVLAKRLDKAVSLYKNNVAPKIIVTGDHGTDGYDEVNAMRAYLTDNGVRIEDIFMDHAGFDTYSSMYRARDIFMVKSTVVTSQNYHNIRAVYIGRKLGMEVYGSAAEDVYIGRLAFLRETAARVKAFFDVKFDRKPKFLGESIPVSGDGRVTEG